MDCAMQEQCTERPSAWGGLKIASRSNPPGEGAKRGEADRGHAGALPAQAGTGPKVQP